MRVRVPWEGFVNDHPRLITQEPWSLSASWLCRGLVAVVCHLVGNLCTWAGDGLVASCVPLPVAACGCLWLWGESRCVSEEAESAGLLSFPGHTEEIIPWRICVAGPGGMVLVWPHHGGAAGPLLLRCAVRGKHRATWPPFAKRVGATLVGAPHPPHPYRGQSPCRVSFVLLWEPRPHSGLVPLAPFLPDSVSCSDQFIATGVGQLDNTFQRQQLPCPPLPQLFPSKL